MLDEGQAAWFGPDTWQHGFAAGERDVHVLEFFAPPPAGEMSQAYVRTRPFLAAPGARPRPRPLPARGALDVVLPATFLVAVAPGYGAPA